MGCSALHTTVAPQDQGSTMSGNDLKWSTVGYRNARTFSMWDQYKALCKVVCSAEIANATGHHSSFFEISYGGLDETVTAQ